jgi:lipopolysaccharide O-acetyltransferase
MLKKLYNNAFRGIPFSLKKVGRKVKILRPRSIIGGKHITIESSVFIHRHSTIFAIEKRGNQRFTPRIFIGSKCYIGVYAMIAAVNEVTIEEYCVLSDYVYISDVAHGLDPLAGPIMEQPLESKGPVRLGKGTFIGYRAAIMPGVSLGCHCVVGSNSIVTHSFPDYSMLIGSPARCVKVYSVEQKCWKSPNPSSKQIS